MVQVPIQDRLKDEVYIAQAPRRSKPGAVTSEYLPHQTRYPKVPDTNMTGSRLDFFSSRVPIIWTKP